MAEQLPDFQWSRFYYPQILEALIEFKSQNWPEHTETDVHDPAIQLLRLFALVGHQQAVRLDHVAREIYLGTLRLRASMIALAALVDYQLALAVPATVDVLATLNAGGSVGQVLARANSRFGTEGTSESPPILFEFVAEADLVLTQDVGAYGFGSAVLDAAIPLAFDALFDHTGAELGADLWGDGGGLSPSGGAPALLFWHPELQFNQITVVISAAGSLDPVLTRFEYFDDLRILPPGAVVDLAGTILLSVTELVGNVVDSDGLEVVVTMLRTGQQEILQTTSDTGGNQFVTTTGTLGQTTVSVNPSDYLVQTFWPEVPGLVDDSSGLTVSGDIVWQLPQGADRRWQQVTLVNVADNQQIGPAWFMRARVFDDGGDTAPALDAPEEPSGTTWTLMLPTTQGRQVVERTGTTDAGTASQFFDLRQSPLLELVSVVLSDGTWDRVDTFLSSTAFDRHYTLLEEPDGTQRLKFGDGTRGKIPPASSAVTSTYRIGGAQSGNVGPLAISRDRTGNSKLTKIRNPRAALGWVEQEGITSLALTRLQIPASLRAGDRAVTPEDIEFLAVRFRTEDEAQVAERALAIQEGAGPKTVELVAVAPGGAPPTIEQLAELELFFNGELQGLQRIGGVILANTTVVAVAFTPKVVDVTATVSVLSDFAAGAENRIEAALESVLTPTAKRLILDDDGVWQESAEFQWDFDGSVPVSFLIARIVTSISGITNTAVTVPALDIALAADELPVVGTLAITVVVV